MINQLCLDEFTHVVEIDVYVTQHLLAHHVGWMMVCGQETFSHFIFKSYPMANQRV
jgi:hypothetical protein